MLETPILLWGQHQWLSNTCFRNFLGLQSSLWLPLCSTSLRGQKNSEKNMKKLRAYIMATLLYVWIWASFLAYWASKNFPIWKLGNVLLLDRRIIAATTRKEKCNLSSFSPVQRTLFLGSHGRQRGGLVNIDPDFIRECAWNLYYQLKTINLLVLFKNNSFTFWIPGIRDGKRHYEFARHLSSKDIVRYAFA